MLKIMYVEDELSRYIPSLIKLFGKYLSDAEKKALQDADSDQRGANVEDIRKILTYNPVIEVFDSFKEVLEHIRNLTPNELKAYDMFILDRNLTEDKAYHPDEIQRIDKCFEFSRYQEREGDYLALQLHLKGCPIKEKVFFLSAYKAMSFGATEIARMVEYGTFFHDNFFDKGQSAELIKLINNRQWSSLFAEHRDIFGIITKAELGIEDAVMRILLEAQKPDAKLTMDWRTAINSCLLHIAKYKQFWYRSPNKGDGIGELIGKLDRGDDNSNTPGSTPEHIRVFFDNINTMINVYVAHPMYQMPSPYAVKALTYELLEIITWIGANCK